MVERLLEDGRLPTLSGLIGNGALIDIESPAGLSGAIWPTFVTGTAPEAHGAIGEWRWHPDEMRLRHYSGADLRPFWSDLCASGLSVGMVDVPSAMRGEIGAGFRLTDWGAQDRVLGYTAVEPASLDAVVSRHGKHPFADEPRPAVQPNDAVGLGRIATRCRAGMALRVDLVLDLLRARPVDLAIVGFPELHVAGHLLWHTLEDGPNRSHLAHAIPDLYAAADRELARLLDGCGADTTVIVLSFHGMRRGGGVVTLLEPLLTDLGVMPLDAATSMAQRTWPAKLLAEVKERVPESFRFAYRRRVPFPIQRRVAEQNITPAHDWSRTEAFSMCRHHPNWVRINLRGRERDGIVPADAFEAKRDAIAVGLLSKRSPSGASLVESVARPTQRPHPYLPDLVVTWASGAYERPARVAGTPIAVWPVDPHRTGEHQSGGWTVGLSPVDGGKVPVAEIAAITIPMLI